MRHDQQLRIARPVSDLSRARSMYCEGLGLRVIDSFENHEGFDGVMLGLPDASYHFEFTHYRDHPLVPAPTAEDLAVFYIPVLSEWRSACARMKAAGFKQVASFNPYWDRQGKTFEDPDRYRIVLQNAEWSNRAGGGAETGGGARGPHRDAPSRTKGGGSRPRTVRSP